MEPSKIKILSELLGALRDQTITASQICKLEQLMESDSEAMQFYIDYVLLYSELAHGQKASRQGSSESLAEPAEQADLFDQAECALGKSWVWRALADFEKTAETIEVQEQRHDQFPQFASSTACRKRVEVARWAVWTAALSAAMLLFMIGASYLVPMIWPDGGQLTDQVMAEWSDLDLPTEIDAHIPTGDMSLERGFAEIRLVNGVRLTLQAPVSFEIYRSGDVFLTKGALSALVPPKAKGFTIFTPKASVVDFGTEFGVAVLENDDVETYVFRGSVEMRARAKTQSLSLNAGDAGKTDGYSLRRRTAGEGGVAFVRNLTEVRDAVSCLGQNLIVNGGFEANVDVGSSNDISVDHMFRDVQIEHWDDQTSATLVPYMALGGPLCSVQERAAATVPPDHGDYYFCGFENGETTQTIDLSGISALVKTGKVNFSLSGWLGGWADHGDSVVVFAEFYDEDSVILGRAKIGPVTVSQRKGSVNFVPKNAAGKVPPNAHTAKIIIKTLEETGAADAFLDNLEMVLSWSEF